MKILFTSVGRRVELLQMFRNAAQKLKKELMICGSDIDVSAPALQFCDKTVITPRIKTEEYIPFLVDYCKKEKINVLIPTIDTDLLILSENIDLFKEVGTKVVISSPEKIKICRDKNYTAEYFNSVGLNSPLPVDDITKYTGGFPAFIKPKDGSSSINAYKVNSLEELKTYSDRVPDYIVQPFITGTEYTIDVFCDFDGNLIYATPRIRLAVRAGEVLKTEIRTDKIMIEEMKALVADYKPCGAITVQLIKDDSTGINWYIEINPRFGGGAPLSMKAGADSACALLKILSGEKVDFDVSAAEDRATFSRFDQSVRVK